VWVCDVTVDIAWLWWLRLWWVCWLWWLRLWFVVVVVVVVVSRLWSSLREPREGSQEAHGRGSRAKACLARWARPAVSCSAQLESQNGYGGHYFTLYIYIAGAEQKRETIVTRKCVEMGID